MTLYKTDAGRIIMPRKKPMGLVYCRAVKYGEKEIYVRLSQAKQHKLYRLHRQNIGCEIDALKARYGTYESTEKQ